MRCAFLAMEVALITVHYPEFWRYRGPLASARSAPLELHADPAVTAFAQVARVRAAAGRVLRPPRPCGSCHIAPI